MRWLGWIVAVLLLICAACSPSLGGRSQGGTQEAVDVPAAVSPSEAAEKRSADRPQKKEEKQDDRPNRDGTHSDDSGGRTKGVLVTRAVDGDTIEVRMGGRIVDIRLIGIDTPESVAPGQPVECYGLEASAFTSRQLEGKRVRLTYDVERKDYYGRTLAYVWDGGMFNLALVRTGYATAYPYEPNTRFADRFAAAERVAHEHDRGLWGECNSGGGGGGGSGSGSSGGGGGCDSSYPGVCIPTYPPDLDCSQIPESNFKVQGSDPHGFDGNHDGRGCES